MWCIGGGWGVGGGWWMLMGWIWMVVFWGLIIWGIYTIVNAITKRGGAGVGSQDGEPSAIEILERRYARGEISAGEFEEARRRLLERSLEEARR